MTNNGQMSNESFIAKLEQELHEMRNIHETIFDNGVGIGMEDLMRQEEELRNQIIRLKTIVRWKEAGLLNESSCNKFGFTI